MLKVLSGNKAAVYGAKLARVEVAAVYPITCLLYTSFWICGLTLWRRLNHELESAGKDRTLGQ